MFRAALGSQPAPSFCFAGRSQRLRSGVSRQRLGFGACRSSPWVARPRSCGPSDHAWCVAADVDPHWAGVGATVATIERLLSDRRLDAVATDPDSEQPAYR